MSLILTVFSNRGYARYRLPPGKDMDGSLWFSDKVFRLTEPICIPLENIRGDWYITMSPTFFFRDTPEGRRRLAAGDRFDLVTIYEEIFTVSVTEEPFRFHAWGKYHLWDRVSVGRSEESDIMLSGRQGVSRVHAVIWRQGEDWYIDSQGINGLYLNGCFVEDRARLSFGDHINVMGFGLVFLKHFIAADTGLPGVRVRLARADGKEEGAGPVNVPKEPSPLMRAGRSPFPVGKRMIHRAPRSMQELETREIRIDNPPDPEEGAGQPLILSVISNTLMTLPMAAGSLFLIYASGRERGAGQGGGQLYLYSGLFMAALTLLAALAWVMVQGAYDRLTQRKRQKSLTENYRRYLTKKKEEIRTLCEERRNLLHNLYPDAGRMIREGIREEKLWTRSPFHKDFLLLRIGSGTMPLPVKLQIEEKRFQRNPNPLLQEMEEMTAAFHCLEEVPALLSLTGYNRIGIVAETERERAALARNLMIQIACSHCYTEVRIGLVYDARESCCPEVWDYARWLPHVWSGRGDFRFLAENREQARKLFYRLQRLFRKRKAGQGGQILPHYVLFLAAPHFLEGEPVESVLTQEAGGRGITLVWLAGGREFLPHACQLVMESASGMQFLYDLQTGDRREVVFDRISEEAAGSFSRSLSCLQVREEEEEEDIPAEVAFLQILGVEKVEDLAIRDNWRKNRTIDSLQAPVGLMAGGKKKYLDIHERYHGPHGLVAGTTGSGKSELLQTYLLSLFLLYSPKLVNVFLIDYKGGGLAGMFDGLPHVCGQISNLSGAQTARAMVSLRSENKRRQRIFRKYRVNNISDYLRLYYKKEDMEPMPHLLIIIDEFAELKREEPDFMQELISIAQVGRSLGLHLILATQKPGGTVDDLIWSNARFRMCLRVQEREDSMDMLHRPDAADLTQTGRCCFQVGNDEIYELFQSGFSGACYHEGEEEERSAWLISLSGEAERAEPASPEPEETEGVPEPEELTQFEAVKRAMIKTAGQEGFQKSRQLWMEPLPDRIFWEAEASEKKALQAQKGSRTCLIRVGLADDPANQTRLPLLVSMESHLLVCGLPGTGKSTFLQTILWAATKSFPPSRLQFYVIDYSSGALLPFEDMPHCGGIVRPGQEGKAKSLFYMLSEKVKERKTLFAGAGYGQYARLNQDAPARILLVIDHFSSFYGKTEQCFEEAILELLKEGEGVGILLFLSCGGLSSSELPLQMAEYICQMYCLQMKEKYSYSDILGTLKLPVLPEAGKKGRGISQVDGRILEFQTALAVESADDYDRMKKIRKEAGSQKADYQGILPEPIRYIPEKPVLSEYYELAEVRRLLREEKGIPLGYFEHNALIAGLSSRGPACLLITGKRKTGKHNLLRLILQGLLMRKQSGEELTILAWGHFPGIRAGSSAKEKISFLSDSKELEEFLVSLPAGPEPCLGFVYILIENMGRLLEQAEEACPDLLQLLQQYWEKPQALPTATNAAADQGGVCGSQKEQKRQVLFRFVAVMEEEDLLLAAEKDVFRSFCADCAGIHLGGSLVEESLFDHGSLSFEEQTAVFRPGTGHFFLEGEEPKKIIIPKVDKT